jgi:hypothetical protein
MVTMEMVAAIGVWIAQLYLKFEGRESTLKGHIYNIATLNYSLKTTRIFKVYTQMLIDAVNSLQFIIPAMPVTTNDAYDIEM